jgi:hypothetical protein
MDEITKLLKESTLLLGIMIADVDGDPKAVQFFDLRIIAAAKKHLAEVNKIAKEKGW